MIDTLPWSSCLRQSPWLPCTSHTISFTGPSVSPSQDFSFFKCDKQTIIVVLLRIVSFSRRKKTQNVDKECVECKWCGFYNVFNRFHCSIELWRMVMNQVGRKNFVEKPPTFVPLGKSPVMRAIFAGPLLTPLFSRAAFS